MADYVNPTPRRLDIRFIDVVVFVEMLLLTLTYSRLYTLFPAFRTSINIAAIAIPLSFVPLAFFRRPVSALATVAMMLIIVSYQIWFAFLWQTPFTGSAIGGFQGLALTAMIAMHARNRDPSRFMAILFMATIVYLMLHIYFYRTIDAAYIDNQLSHGKGDFAASISRTHASIDAHGGAGEYRLAVSGTHFTFAFLYALCWLTTARGIGSRCVALLFVAFTGFCLWISDSRFNTASTLFVAASVFIPLAPRLKAAGYFSAAVAGMVFYCAAAFANFNAFDFLSFDQSGAARANEFVAANRVYLNTPFLGTGLWNEGADLKVPYNGVDVYPSDLGWYGELLQHGIVGIILLIMCYYGMSALVRRMVRANASPFSIRVFTALLLYFAIVQLISTQLWEGGGAIFLCLAFAYLARNDDDKLADIITSYDNKDLMLTEQQL